MSAWRPWWRGWQGSRWGRALTLWLGGTPEIPPALWQRVIAQQPFLAALTAPELATLKTLCERFLVEKEFSGAHGLLITDEMALTVATQACLPWIHWGLPGLDWYRDFVGIVIHADAVVARRELRDDAGVIHRYRETLAGEAMHGGPLMLAWSHVLGASQGVNAGHNLVIHEFAHKIDMRYKSQYEEANGCPRLPRGYLGLEPQAAALRWQQAWAAAYQNFVREVELAQRFGLPAPWLDDYAAHSPAEFFAVACEAYVVNRPRFAQAFSQLLPLMDGFFRHPGPAPAVVSDATIP